MESSSKGKVQIIMFHNLSLNFITTRQNLHIGKQIFSLGSLRKEVTIFSFSFNCHIVWLRTQLLLKVFC